MGKERCALNISPYCAGKGTIENLTKRRALELADKGVRVNTAAPSDIETNIWNVPGAFKPGRFSSESIEIIWIDLKSGLLICSSR